MNGELWQECRRRGCETEPVCVSCEYCEKHCTCTTREQKARERQEINAIDSDRPAAAGEWEAYRARPGSPANHQEAVESIRSAIAAGRQTREDYDARRRQFEATLYTMHAEGAFDMLRYVELERVVNVIRDFLGLCPFDGEGALTTKLAQYDNEFAP